MGKSGSGKSSVVNELVNQTSLKKIKTYTSRPQRINELDNEYNFISKNKFKQLIEEDFFAEFTTYNTVNGLWYYGTDKKSILNAKSNDIVILNPSGLEQARKTIGKEHIISFYIDVLPNILKQRLTKRGDNSEETERRIRADNIGFCDINFLVDRIVFNNYNFQDCVNQIIDILKYKGVIC